MIRKLKFKLVVLATSALLILLAIIVVGMNLMNYAKVKREADDILTFLAAHNGAFPGIDESNTPNDEGLPPFMSPELPYQLRYFSVLIDGDQAVIHTDISHIASVTEENAADFAARAIADSKGKGFTDRFRFYRYAEGDNTRIIFLDCYRQLDSLRDFLITAIVISCIAYVAVFMALFFLAERIIRPIAVSYEKQKRFITDAGHEIKTPLTIINANTDLLELDIGENESIDDIRQQSQRLRRLTDDLVYLARMEESGGALTMTEFPISDIVSETLEIFDARVKAEGRRIRTDITPMLAIRGNSRSVEQLVSILTDNALKYSSDGSEIFVTLARSGRTVTLSMCNSVDKAPLKDELDLLFDRFYRADPSRNSGTGGHGIGLSIAKAIVGAHGGKIWATVEGDSVFKITATLPIQ